MAKLQLAKGVRDFPPEEMILRQEVMDLLRNSFESYGFNPLETPIIERFDTLSAKYAGGAEILKECFQLQDQGGRQLGLRYDLTVPFSRFVGMNPRLKMPFKRYQIGTVYRDGPIKLGRYREFIQCDVDVVGIKGVIADAEILALASEIFKKLELDVTIKLNSRTTLNKMLEECGVEESKKIDLILSIDKLDKIGKKEVIKEIEEKGISQNVANKIFDIIESKSIISDDIKKILNYLKFFDVDNVEFDPSLARGLSYYTGPVFEIFLNNSKIKSAVAGGGRYDKMISDFLQSKQSFPATGISFGLEVIIEALKLEKKSTKKSVVQIFIIPIATEDKCIEIMQKLRNQGLNVEMDMKKRNISKNLNYCDKKNIPYALIIGEDEIKKGKLKLKNMISGEESLIEENEIYKIIKN